MSRSIETSSASALTASALREHASALDASERDRDAYRDMLAESERRAETLLDMNRQLRAELDAERAAPPGATESDGVLRASLEDARRRLRETEAQLVAVSDGFQLLKRERERVVGVLRSSEGVRAALDEERDAVARLHADVTARRARVASLAVKAASRVDAARVEMEIGDAGREEERDGSNLAAAALVLRRLAGNLRSMGATADEEHDESNLAVALAEENGSAANANAKARVAELESARERRDVAEEKLRGTRERLGGATEANHNLEPETTAEGLLRPGPDPDVDGERTREDQLATTTYALSLPPIGEEESLHLLELPGDEDEFAQRDTTMAATTSRRGVGSDAPRSGSGSGSGSGSESDARRTMLEMWTELQRVRSSHETLRARYAQQTRRLRRARETVLALSEGTMDVDVGVSGSLASVSLSLPPPGLTDSARSSVVTGELSEDDIDADEWTRAAVHAGHAGHAGHARHAGLSRRSRRSRGASSATEEVEEVEEGMDGEDEVLAEYVTAAPPRGPRGHRATQEALARARVASGHRPDSAPESATSTTRGAATRSSAAARRLVQTRTTRRPESAPSSQEVPRLRGTAERPAVHAAVVAAAAGAHARPPSATPSDRRAGAGAIAGAGAGAVAGAVAGVAVSRASRPQTAPSSQHRTLRRPRDAHPTARRHVAFLDDVRMRPGSAVAAPSSPSRVDADPSDAYVRRRPRPSSAADAAPSLARAPLSVDRPIVARRRRERRERDRGRFRG